MSPSTRHLIQVLLLAASCPTISHGQSLTEQVQQLSVQLRSLAGEVIELKLQVVRLQKQAAAARLIELERQLQGAELERSALMEEEFSARHEAAEIEGQMRQPNLTDLERSELLGSQAAVISSRTSEIRNRQNWNIHQQAELRKQINATKRHLEDLATAEALPQLKH